MLVVVKNYALLCLLGSPEFGAYRMFVWRIDWRKLKPEMPCKNFEY